MRAALERVGLLVLSVVIAVILWVQLSAPTTPSEKFCQEARAEGHQCAVAPDTYTASVVVVDEREGFLVIYDDKGETQAVIPLR